jgi:hypothetical protein
MNDNQQAPSSERVPGTRRATLAVVLSVAALVFSVYGLAHQVLDDSGTMISSLPPSQAVDAIMHSRVETLETRQGQFAEDLGKIMAKLDEISKMPLAAAVPAMGDEPKGPVEDLRRKLAELERSNAALQIDMAGILQKKAGLLSDLSLTQVIRRKLQDGTGFSSERRRLSTTDLLPALDSISPPQVSDRALREDLRDLAPKFVQAEKMEQTEGFFQKLWLRVQNLVTVRPREGIAQDSDTGKLLGTVESALARYDWKVAMAAAESVAGKAPPEFSTWRQRLKARAEAEASLDKLEEDALVALRGKGEEMPSAFPAQDDLVPAVPPAAKPVSTKPPAPKEPKEEKEPDEEVNP